MNEKLTLSTDSILFLVVSLFTIGLWVYLPEHACIMYRRIVYYISGALPSSPASSLVSTAAASTFNATQKLAEKVVTAAATMSTAAKGEL